MKYKIVLTMVLAGLYALPAEVAGKVVPLLPVVQAQDKPAVEATATDEDSDADDENPIAGEEDAEADDNFIPTEKINVDSSVSFPVDI